MSQPTTDAGTAAAIPATLPTAEEIAAAQATLAAAGVPASPAAPAAPAAEPAPPAPEPPTVHELLAMLGERVFSGDERTAFVTMVNDAAAATS